MSNRKNRNSIFLISMPRSGSTWLGAILNSHPSVLYVHEPDSDLPPPDSLEPFRTKVATQSTFTDANEWFDSIRLLRTTRTSLTFPLFHKQYRSYGTDFAYRINIIVAKTMEKAGFQIKVPSDLINLDLTTPIEVVKSISLLQRVGWIRHACPNASIVHLIRHPCGYVASRLQGEREHLLKADTFVRVLARTPWAVENGWSLAKLQKLSVEEQFAIGWVATNEFAIETLDNDTDTVLVKYDKFCESPWHSTQSLFRHLEIEPCEQTRKFISRSTSGSFAGTKRYYSIRKNSISASQKWHSSLSNHQINSILALVEGSKSMNFVNGSATLLPANANRIKSGPSL